VFLGPVHKKIEKDSIAATSAGLFYVADDLLDDAVAKKSVIISAKGELDMLLLDTIRGHSVISGDIYVVGGNSRGEAIYKNNRLASRMWSRVDERSLKVVDGKLHYASVDSTRLLRLFIEGDNVVRKEGIVSGINYKQRLEELNARVVQDGDTYRLFLGDEEIYASAHPLTALTPTGETVACHELLPRGWRTVIGGQVGSVKNGARIDHLVRAADTDEYYLKFDATQ
jgi:hypothetical protein